MIEEKSIFSLLMKKEDMSPVEKCKILGASNMCTISSKIHNVLNLLTDLNIIYLSV